MGTALHIKGKIKSAFLLMIFLPQSNVFEDLFSALGKKATAEEKTKARVKAVFSKPKL